MINSFLLVTTLTVSNVGLLQQYTVDRNIMLSQRLQATYYAKAFKKKQMREIYQQLELTEKQKRDLEDNRKQHHRQIQVLIERIDALKKMINTEFVKSDFDENKIEEWQAELSSLRQKLSQKRLDAIMSIRRIMTPRQYELFQKLTNE